MNAKTSRRIHVVNRELLDVERKEKKLRQAAKQARHAAWKTALEGRIPEKVYMGLESAFSKGFAAVFTQGQSIIERSYNKEALRSDYAVRDYAVQLKGGRKELKQMHKSAKQSNAGNLTVTAVEGIGLGVLGVGMFDIVLFLGIILKGIYETALNFGFDYESEKEQYLILKMMETALSSGDDWVRKNAEVDLLLVPETAHVMETDLKKQMKDTSSAFAVDMLLLKFIQGIPVIGVLGGAANPVYYTKIMKYVQLKYRKRYLLKRMTNERKAFT